MNQEALRVSYDQAVEEGYNGDMSEFYTLLQTNTEAADLAYNMATEEGYKSEQLNFELLLGLQKKEENFPVSGFLPHGVISHDSWPMFSS